MLFTVITDALISVVIAFFICMLLNGLKKIFSFFGNDGKDL